MQDYLVTLPLHDCIEIKFLNTNSIKIFNSDWTGTKTNEHCKGETTWTVEALVWPWSLGPSVKKKN